MLKFIADMFRDERGSTSISRVNAFLSFAFVTGATTWVTIKTGAPVEIPESWLTLFGITMGGYLGAKGINIGVGKMGGQDASISINAGVEAIPPQPTKE